MGQTLTHGIYLPDEGERNCYSGLAANWQLLDGAVGTIAEHTTQIAGKAPAVHTHTKADITDLLNSNFIPGANNSYDLGSSSYQWNNLYAKNYYYNGVAWGLDKANTWTGNNSYTGIVSLNSSSDVAEQFKQKLPKDVLASNDAMARVNSLVDSAGHYVVVETIGHWSNYVAKNITLKYKNDSTKQRAIEFRLYSDGTGILYPQTPFECDLGNSYNKWKTLNGIGPGALSLPSGNYDPIDTNSWDLTGATGQSYTPTVDGWLFISIQNIAGNYLSIVSGRGAISIDGTGVQGGLRAMLPVIANESVIITVKTGAIFAARFYPMQGNVS